jgi:hypothetical protein
LEGEKLPAGAAQEGLRKNLGDDAKGILEESAPQTGGGGRGVKELECRSQEQQGEELRLYVMGGAMGGGRRDERNEEKGRGGKRRAGKAGRGNTGMLQHWSLSRGTWKKEDPL